MTDRPEGKPIEHIGRIIRAEIRTKATPQEAYEVQAWLSAFSLDPSTVEAFGKKWQQRLQEIFQN
jgi:hypothetical protein